MRVDPWRACTAGETVQGGLTAARVPRIAATARLDTPLTARLRFDLDEAGTPVVDVEVRGCYGFTCQRCLQPMQDRRLDCSQVLIAADEGARLALEPRGEVVVCARGGALELAALVEDEVLLALPLAPCHAFAACAGEPGHPAAAQGPGDEHNPFAVLAALKRGRDDDRGR